LNLVGVAIYWWGTRVREDDELEEAVE
jgi:hypothetical protein